MRQKPPKRRGAAKTREDRQEATAPNGWWAMDIVPDQLFEGPRFNMLTVVDIYSTVYPAMGIRTGYRRRDVVQTVEQATQAYGGPKSMRVDNEPTLGASPRISSTRGKLDRIIGGGSTVSSIRGWIRKIQSNNNETMAQIHKYIT